MNLELIPSTRPLIELCAGTVNSLSLICKRLHEFDAMIDELIYYKKRERHLENVTNENISSHNSCMCNYEAVDSFPGVRWNDQLNSQ